jgi:hypothetical protein
MGFEAAHTVAAGLKETGDRVDQRNLRVGWTVCLHHGVRTHLYGAVQDTPCMAFPAPH